MADIPLLDGHWSGTDRRADSLSEDIKRMADWLVAHEKEEREQHKEVQEKIESWQTNSQIRQEAIMRRIDEMGQSTLSVVHQQNQSIKEQGVTIKEIHEMFKAAFPGGDPVKHCLEHEESAQEKKDRRETFLKLKQHVINWVAVAIIGWGSVVLWLAFLQGPHK